MEVVMCDELMALRGRHLVPQLQDYKLSYTEIRPMSNPLSAPGTCELDNETVTPHSSRWQ